MIPHPKQRAFIECPNRIKLAFCGNRGGKSIAGLVFEIIWRCMGIHPLQKAGIYKMPPLSARIIEPKLTSHIENFIVPLMEKMFGAEWKAGKYDQKSHRFVFPVTKSELDMMSSDQDLDQFGAVDKDLIWIDEPTRADIWNEQKMRIMMTHGSLILTMTPLAENPYVPWIFRDLYGNAKPYGKHNEHDMVRFQWGIRDNIDVNGKCRVSDEEIEEITRGMTEEQKRIVLYGDFQQLKGLILPRFNNMFNLVKRSELPDDLIFMEAIDWHPRKDIYILWVGIDRKGNLYVVDHAKVNGNIKEIALAIRQKRRGKRISFSVIDWLSNMKERTEDGKGNSPRRMLRDYGIHSTNVTKDNQFKVRLIQEAFAFNKKLGRSKCRVVDDQKEVIDQLKMWHWDESMRGSELKEKKQTAAKKDDDYCDCLGYILLKKPTYELWDNSIPVTIRHDDDVTGYHTEVRQVMPEYVEDDGDGELVLGKKGWYKRPYQGDN
jgi:hypothetical protein